MMARKLSSIFFAVMFLAAVGQREEEFSAPVERGVSLSPAETFARAREYFEAGDDGKAADYFILAVKGGPSCAAGFAGENAEMPAGCGPAGPPVTLSRALYRLGEIRRARTLAGPSVSEGRKLRAGALYFQRAVKEGEDDEWRARAGLALTEAGLCLDDAGYPDCAMWAIESYEKWMKDYPRSELRDEVALRLAENYHGLADRFDQENTPWFNRAKAELCRGRALELAQLLSPTLTRPEHLSRLRALIHGIKDSGKPYSIVPASAIPYQEK